MNLWLSTTSTGATGPLPVVVLTGFLESGNTSFLRRVPADPEAAETAMPNNEFGEVGLDHLMAEATRPGDVVLLPGKGAPGSLRRLPSELSGGQQQRVALTGCHRPRVVTG